MTENNDKGLRFLLRIDLHLLVLLTYLQRLHFLILGLVDEEDGKLRGLFCMRIGTLKSGIG